MQKLSDGMLLYHGSYMVVDTPDLAKCAARKDYGKVKGSVLFQNE